MSESNACPEYGCTRRGRRVDADVRQHNGAWALLGQAELRGAAL